MTKVGEWLKRSYIYIVLALTYIPLVFAVIFSFNKTSDKGYLNYFWTGGTTNAYKTFFEEGRDLALINSLLIAFFTAIFVIIISLITVFALWRQKNRKYSAVVKGVNNIPLINPDNITAIGLVLIFGILFGTLSNTSEGISRGIAGHTIMALPYGITLMLPRSEKFSLNQYEASQDLGYSKIKSWFKTYFVYMIPSIIFTACVTTFLSLDDFIILKSTTNTSTLGTKLYEGQFKPWGLVIGAFLLLATILGNIIYISYKAYANKKAKARKVKDE